MDDDSLRIDKWLWHVRIFKSRTISTDACKKGRVKCNDKVVKPSFQAKVDDEIKISKDGFELIFKVIKLIKKRVGAPIAAECYENMTSADELNKFKHWFVGKGAPERRDRGSGRPTKKERREIEGFKEDYFFDWDE